MNYVEYGKENSDVIILLHGGGLSWWNYKEVAERLQTDYHVVLPILYGHAGCDKQFTTIENNALEIYTPKVRHIWRCISVTVVPFYISEPQGSFLCGFATQWLRTFLLTQ